MPRFGQTPAQVRRPPPGLQHQLPIILDQRLREHGAASRPHAIRKRAEQLRVGDLPLLERNRLDDPIHRHRNHLGLGGGTRRDPDRWIAEDIVVDQQVDRLPAPLASQSRQGEILEPDAGMKQLRLVPGQDQRPVVADRRIRVPIRTGMTLRFLQQVAASFRAKLMQRDTLHVVNRLPRNPPILVDQPRQPIPKPA